MRKFGRHLEQCQALRRVTKVLFLSSSLSNYFEIRGKESGGLEAGPLKNGGHFWPKGYKDIYLYTKICFKEAYRFKKKKQPPGFLD